ncbi:hypothetical protein EV193_11479 [Herbihabitans rhizosphaerae]|uniref:Restriction endonuclease type II-like domain-containing protein n=1 Tax=Herbihabitans rhizosphaerae TaxID=1872711 RepID=A0A4Q7KCX3_9PSEU|nr:hypothetical protein EV193_11479 [Herbihabitans rhizosphaerae]
MGVRVAAQRLDEVDGMAESILETAGRLALADASVPAPTAQYVVAAPGGRIIARLDAAYPTLRTGIEYDGRRVHDAPQALYRDRERQNALVALGWTILRYTWWDVIEDPARFVASVRNALQPRQGLRSI